MIATKYLNKKGMFTLCTVNENVTLYLLQLLQLSPISYYGRMRGIFYTYILLHVTAERSTSGNNNNTESVPRGSTYQFLGSR